ncbi:MAG: ATP-dependent DNA helicase [archaeon]
MNIYFPYTSIRKTQDVFINDLVKSIEEKKDVIAHVPTGVGKTAAILSTTLNKVIDKKLTVFFLTPRHTQHKIVIETLNQIKDKFNLKINVVDFIGKRHMCSVDNVLSLSNQQFYEYCKDVKEKNTCEFYINLKKEKVRLKAFLRELENKILNVEDMIVLAKQEKFCPFEIASELARKANVIIGDYNHLLSLRVRETFFKRINKEMEDSILIFDEAHNLPEKCRELLSDYVSTYALDLAIKEAKEFKIDHKSVEEIKNILLRLSKKIPLDNNEILIDKKDFDIENYSEILLDLKLKSNVVLEDKKYSYLNSLSNFMLSWKGPNEGFVRILKREFIRNKINFILYYKCLDPSFLTKEIINNSYITVAMSGTLTPLEMYKDLLGFENVNLFQYNNPFPKKNRLNLIVPGLTTKFTLRNEEMYNNIALKCSSIINNIPGNIIVYFPSYDIRDNINRYLEKLIKKTTFLEYPGLSKSDKSLLLEKFKSYKDNGAVILAVSSGSFGEGIDLIGDYLKAVLVVGIPLTKPDIEIKALIDYYDIKFKKGWDYAYIYPAIIKTIQNAGRCIRSETDKGIIVFIDERYKWNNYLKCFPVDFDFKISKDILLEINNFLNQENK